MNKLFLYNPENDIALAYNSRNRFTPPRQAALLAKWGAPLMWWMGDCADYLLVAPVSSCEEDSNRKRWLECMEKLRYDSGPQLIASCNGLKIGKAVPWGWSSHAIDRLHDAGLLPEAVSYMVNNLDAVRSLSHRRSAGMLNIALRECFSDKWEYMLLADPAKELFSSDAVWGYMEEVGTSVYVKSPWSSSGRGVVNGDMLSRNVLISRCEAVIRKQGSVLIERAHEKVIDFAMLFRADPDGSVHFYGLSRFFNERGAGYTGNLIVSDSRIHQELMRYIPGELIEDVRNRLSVELSALIAGRYIGYMGVDMMIVRTGDAFALVPCVELNLRMTMGVLAHRFNTLTGMEGVMRVIPGKRPTASPAAVPLVPENEYFNVEFVACDPYSGTSNESGSVAGVCARRL